MATHKNLRTLKSTALVLGLLWMTIGCGPSTLVYFLAPFSDDRIPPEHKLATNKEITVCIVTNFAMLETRPESIRADEELAELFAQHLRKRCQENKEKVKVVPPAKVRDFKRQADFATRSMQDIGKHFQADFVINLEIGNFSIYERGSSHSLYRGDTELSVQVIDVSKPLGEGTVFTKPYRRPFPTNGPRDANEMTPPQFRTMFLNAVASDMTRLFTAYPKEQRLIMD